jgi:fumarylacetoacetase
MQATQISPWVVTLEALQPYRCPAPTQDPPVLPYLAEAGRHSWDISLSVGVVAAESSGRVETTLATPSLRHL